MKRIIISLAMAGALSACSTAQVAQIDTVTAGFISLVQQGAADACKIIPIVNTIEAVAAAVSGGASIVGNAVVNATVNAICSAAPPPASARFRSLPTQAQSPSVPAYVGTTAGGITVNGWRATAIHFGHRHH